MRDNEKLSLRNKKVVKKYSLCENCKFAIPLSLYVCVIFPLRFVLW